MVASCADKKNCGRAGSRTYAYRAARDRRVCRPIRSVAPQSRSGVGAVAIRRRRAGAATRRSRLVAPRWSRPVWRLCFDCVRGSSVAPRWPFDCARGSSVAPRGCLAVPHGLLLLQVLLVHRVRSRHMPHTVTGAPSAAGSRRKIFSAHVRSGARSNKIRWPASAAQRSM